MSYAPRGLHFEDFTAGRAFTTTARTVAEGAVDQFAGLSGDFNPLHVDEERARQSPLKGRIAHGMLVLSIATGQANQLGIFEGTTLALLGMDRIRWTAPVRLGDTIHTVLTVREARESSKPDRGVVVFDVTVRNQRDETVCQSEWTTLMARRMRGVVRADRVSLPTPEVTGGDGHGRVVRGRVSLDRALFGDVSRGADSSRRG